MRRKKCRSKFVKNCSGILPLERCHHHERTYPKRNARSVQETSGEGVEGNCLVSGREKEEKKRTRVCWTAGQLITMRNTARSK